MDVEVWEMPHGLGVEGHQVWFDHVDWRWKAIKCVFYHTDRGVLRTRKVRALGWFW
jgi:hypothetical protein